MRTTRKQFPVNWVTSGRLPFTIQRAKARRSQQMKKNGGLSGGKMWRDFELINCPSSTKNLQYKLVKTSTQKGPLQATAEIS